MASLATKATNQAVQVTLSLLEDVFSSSLARHVAVRLWDGTTWKPEPAEPTRCTLVLHHPGALRKMFLPPSDLNLGEAYIYNDFDIEGEIEAILPLMEHFVERRWGKVEQLRYGKRLLSLPKMGQPRTGDTAAKVRGLLHSKERDRQATNFHYDRSNDFFALWLDSRMIYSCAYLATPEDDLETAQERKLDYLCRKLRLRPGERLLDIGCGWGGLLIYAAQHYGVEADGITLSLRQAELARERINLLTLHSTKGLEFSRVYILGVEDAQLPGGTPMRPATPGETEEARRLLYVGMTRARDRLVLTRAERRGGQRTGGHRPKRFNRLAKKKQAALAEPITFGPVGMKRGEVEDVALSCLVRRPGFRREFQFLGPIEIWILVLGHPARVVQ